MQERVTVLLAAAGAAWEVDAVRALGSSRGVVLLKRCVDLPDLLATAATGQARVVVAAEELPGLDLESVDSLAAAGVALVLVGQGGPVALSGAREHVSPAGVAGLPDVVVRAAEQAPIPNPPDPAEQPDPSDLAGAAVPPGRVVAVWGPAGAPGRTTLAVGVAAATASRVDTLLVDADPYGGAVSQHLGVLDEVSGLLGAARLANAGGLDRDRLAATARTVLPGLRVLTGLPRADRWAEVREAAFESVLEEAVRLCPLVLVDVGFSVEEGEPGFGQSGPRRNQMTLTALGRADEVLVVGSADPVGLSRLARGLVDLLAVAPASPFRVVVNRVRPTIGWGEAEVRAMVEGFVTPVGIHFLPYDREAADRALMEGRAVTEPDGTALGRGVHDVADSLVGGAPGTARRRGPRLRLRTAGTGR